MVKTLKPLSCRYFISASNKLTSVLVIALSLAMLWYPIIGIEFIGPSC